MILQRSPRSVLNNGRRFLFRTPIILSASVLIVIWLTIAGVFPVSAKLRLTSTLFLTQTDQPLEPGAQIEKEIAGGETHYYRVVLVAGQYLRVAVEQRGVEVTTSLLFAAPSGASEDPNALRRLR